MAIETVEDAQHELRVAVEEYLADMGDDVEDDGSTAADIFAGMSYHWPASVAAEVARREFGFIPPGSDPAVASAWLEENSRRSDVLNGYDTYGIDR